MIIEIWNINLIEVQIFISNNIGILVKKLHLLIYGVSNQ